MFQLFSLLIFLPKCQGTNTCTIEHECASSSLKNDTIYCEGFASCIDAQTIITSSDFYSSGSYSAYGATNVISGNDSYCNGDSSCRNITYFQTQDYTYCRGYRSCFQSTIQRPNSTTSYSDIIFVGDESGAFATLNLNQNTNIEARGMLSLYKSNINMYKSSRVDAHGYGSLSGANLYCENGQICNIACHEYGCYNVSSMNGNGTYDIDCRKNRVLNILCNDKHDEDDISISAQNDISSILAKIDFQDVDTLSLCANSSVNCGNTQECQSHNISFLNEAICCSAYRSCRFSSTTLTVNVSSMDISEKFADMIDIYCGGHRSCRSGTSKIVIQSDNNDNYNSNISQSFATFDVFCDGYNSCKNSNLFNGNNLFCRGSYSCDEAIIDSIDNVFAFGNDAIVDATVSNISGNIYCLGYKSCEYSSLFAISGNIYALAEEALYNVTINNTLCNTISNNLYIIGYQSCYQSKITNVQSIFATGYQVLHGAIISGFRELHVNHIDSLSTSVITTGLTINDTSASNSKVKLFINGTNDNDYYITCSNGDECIINCLSITGCTNMNLTCNGICYLNCGDYGDVTGNDCPSNISGVWYPINLIPTSYPTGKPTLAPTELPTDIGSTGAASSDLATESPNETTTSAMISTFTLSGDDDNNDDAGKYNSDIDILLVVMIILGATFCTIIIVSIICAYAFYKKKELDVQEKKIELDIMNNHLNLIINNNNNNKHKNNQTFVDSKTNGIVNLRETGVKNDDACTDIGIVEVDSIDDDDRDDENVNTKHDLGETDHDRQSISYTGSSVGKVNSTEGQLQT